MYFLIQELLISKQSAVHVLIRQLHLQQVSQTFGFQAYKTAKHSHFPRFCPITLKKIRRTEAGIIPEWPSQQVIEAEEIKRKHSKKTLYLLRLFNRSYNLIEIFPATFFFLLYYFFDHPERILSIKFGFFAGAHMNPAVTLAFAVVRRIPWRKVPVYWTAQMLGAFVASACAYAVYYGECNVIQTDTQYSEVTVLVRALSGKCKDVNCFAWCFCFSACFFYYFSSSPSPG